MPSDGDYLRLARSNFCQSLAELSNPAARKVTYSVGGRSLSWTEYQRFLLDSIKAVDEQLAMDIAGSPLAEVISVVGDAGPFGRFG
jgi:hypothetical protein